MAGLLGLFGETPQPKQVELDPATGGLLHQGTDLATRSGDQYATDMNQNVANNAKSLQQNDQQAAQESQKLGMDPGFFGGLRNAYNAQSDATVQKLMRQNSLKAEMQRSDQMSRMAKAAMAQQQAATQNYAMLTKAYNESEMARAQLVSSLYQTAGTAVGTMAGNPAAMKKPGGNVDGYTKPELGASASNPNQGYGLGVSDSGAGGYGFFPGASPQSGHNLGGNFSF